MRQRTVVLSFLLASMALAPLQAAPLQAAPPPVGPPPAAPSPATRSASATATETWVVTTDLWGNPLYQTLALRRDGDRVAGRFDGDPLEGHLDGGTLRFTATASDGRQYRYAGTLSGEGFSGSADLPDPNDPARRVARPFQARRVPDRPPGPPRLHTFVPRDHANEFSPHRAPVLTIWPGDRVRTTLLDSGGVDAQGTTRALYGNPQTGPFFVAGAEVGDTLVVTLRRLRLDRDYADSLDDIVGRARTPRLAASATALGKPVRWTLDTAAGVARPTTPSPGLAGFSVPLRPMLGGLAVAPGFGSAPVSTGDSGRFGGNMDVNAIVEGSIVSLPVLQPGALLYLGDAHALQGDGETSQFALETSMDVEFSVALVRGRQVPMPRIESPTQIMALGQAGSLDDALRQATAGITQWLQEDYGLTLSECAQVLGTSVHYDIANLAGRNVGVLARIDKARLAGLTRVPAAAAP